MSHSCSYVVNPMDTIQVRPKQGGILIGPSASELDKLEELMDQYNGVRRQGLTYFFWGKK